MSAPIFGQFDPFLIKHEIPDLTDRSHPIFFIMQEEFESWAQALEGLKTREAYVRVGNRASKIRTLNVPTPKCTPEQLAEIIERYAHLLLVPKDQIAAAFEPANNPARGQLVFRAVPISPNDNKH
jgi:type II secretory pathway component PulM